MDAKLWSGVAISHDQGAKAALETLRVQQPKIHLQNTPADGHNAIGSPMNYRIRLIETEKPGQYRASSSDLPFQRLKALGSIASDPRGHLALARSRSVRERNQECRNSRTFCLVSNSASSLGVEF